MSALPCYGGRPHITTHESSTIGYVERCVRCGDLLRPASMAVTPLVYPIRTPLSSVAPTDSAAPDAGGGR